MNDEFDSILSGSLRDRAAHADTAGRGFGDVRRRVRRRRQRHVAAGLLPGALGIGWLASRPVASDPLTPAAGDSTACLPVASTVPPPIDLVATTHPDPNFVPPVTYGGPPLTYANGSLVATPTTVVLEENPMTSTSYGVSSDPKDVPDSTVQTFSTTTLPVGANGLPATTIAPAYTIAVEGDGLPVEGLCSPEEQSDSTTPVTSVPTDFSRVLLVDASTDDIVYAVSLFPGSAATTTGVRRDQSFVYVINGDDADGIAAYVAATLGEQFGDMPLVETAWDANHIYENFGLTGIDLSQYDVVVVLSRDIDQLPAGTSLPVETTVLGSDATSTTSIG